MAIYHLNIRNISRGKGRSAVAAAAYRSGERLRDERGSRVADYRNKSGIDFKALYWPKGVQVWAEGREALWNAVEAAERRKDARLCKEVNIALPVELTRAQKIELAEAYGRWLTNKGLVVDLAVHNIDSDNPHFHAMMTTREVTDTGFGKKHRWLDDKAFIVACRKAWSQIANAWLGAGGHRARIDERSLAEQGVKRKPTVHRGVVVDQMRARGVEPVSRLRTVRSFWGNERVIDYPRLDAGQSRADYNGTVKRSPLAPQRNRRVSRPRERLDGRGGRQR